MFRNWGFLLGEIWVLLILAALIGLLAGWLIWGRREVVQGDGAGDAQLRADLERCRSLHNEKDARIAALEADVASARMAQEAAESAPPPTPAVTPSPAYVGEAPEGVDYDGDGVVEGADEGVKPATLDGPRGGTADDLKRIRGIGPKLEQLCFRLGFYHFDQIAAWTDAEVAWVDANLEGFKGRVSRDEWVPQAKLLAEGGETDFSRRVDKGGVYDA
ncbi:MAG: hypothetical protein ACU0CI_09565 [Shimia sp.]